jgi:hypothetical protein
MDSAFEVHMLNEAGKEKAKALAEMFDELLEKVKVVSGIPPSGSTRELALARTHLELASFYSKKAMAMNPENQV